MTLASRGLLLDLDDTLYAYAPAEQAARAALIPRLARDLSLGESETERRWREARDAVHRRLSGRACAHSRLLYLAEMAHRGYGAVALGRLRAWEKHYWRVFLNAARLRRGARELLDDWRRRSGKVAIVTDLTLGVQLRKLKHFDLLGSIDALVASEEVRFEKPAPDALLLAIERLGVERAGCVVVGDSDERDGAAARAIGLPFVRIDPCCDDLGDARAAIERS